MNSPVSTPHPALPTAAATAPRFVRSLKIHQPVVASNRDFVRAWAARRAKLAAAPARPPR